ncbi:ABC transporter permease [Aestuariivirga sp.]|uniref:ABC transporter permease n=1 Tax=Aestuariivirga sp. TaxID=2650926 RepID=UPI0039E3FEB1
MRSAGERAADLACGAVAVLAFIVLYAPLGIGALFSIVPVDRQGIHWSDATLSWYGSFLQNPSIVSAIETTLLVGIAAVMIAAALAVVLALYVEWEGAMFRRAVELIVYLPFLLPPIVTGLSLLIFFFNAGIARGYITIIIGHTVFVLAVLFRLVQTRLQSIPPSLFEASSDLGASRWQTFRHVLWPQLQSAVATGAILAFTLSFDETLISVFLAGDATTLPLRLWAMMRVGFTPEINALVTVVLAMSIALTVAIALRLKPEDQREE